MRHCVAKSGNLRRFTIAIVAGAKDHDQIIRNAETTTLLLPDPRSGSRVIAARTACSRDRCRTRKNAT